MISSGRTVLVTGASTGIGWATAERLGAAGWDVLAGARKQADLERLDALPGVRAVELDVTVPAHVEAVTEQVGPRLDGLVNNAGILLGGPTQAVGVEAWRTVMETNFLAQVALTTALLPAVIAARGRVVNVGSLNGRVSMPMNGPYCASKFALEAFSDALRQEVAHLGVRVVLLEPGSIATPIWTKAETQLDPAAALPTPELQQQYGRMLQGIAGLTRFFGGAGIPADDCAAVVEKALTVGRPRARYRVGKDAKVMIPTYGVLPEAATDRMFRGLLVLGRRRR